MLSGFSCQACPRQGQAGTSSQAMRSEMEISFCWVGLLSGPLVNNCFPETLSLHRDPKDPSLSLRHEGTPRPPKRPGIGRNLPLGGSSFRPLVSFPSVGLETSNELIFANIVLSHFVILCRSSSTGDLPTGPKTPGFDPCEVEAGGAAEIDAALRSAGASQAAVKAPVRRPPSLWREPSGPRHQGYGKREKGFPHSTSRVLRKWKKHLRVKTRTRVGRDRLDPWPKL